MYFHRCTLYVLSILFFGSLVLLTLPKNRGFRRIRLRSEQGPARIKVDVYMESLCPSSQQFFNKNLFPTWVALRHIIDVEIFPYGRATELVDVDGHASFECQRGPDECRGNMMLSCAQKYSWNIDDLMLFGHCFLKSDDTVKTKGIECARKAGLPKPEFRKCSDDRIEGRRLVRQAGAATAKLDQPINHFPWIMIDNVHTEITGDFKETICDAYKGARPVGCDTKHGNATTLL